MQAVAVSEKGVRHACRTRATSAPDAVDVIIWPREVVVDDALDPVDVEACVTSTTRGATAVSLAHHFGEYMACGLRWGMWAGVTYRAPPHPSQ